MAYRGRLIHPLVAEIAQLDTRATETADNYDHGWRTPKVTHADGERRVELAYAAPIRLLAQVENGSDRAQQRLPAGNVNEGRVTLVFAYFHLEAANLVDTSGQPMLRAGDKLVALYTKAGSLVRRYEPELYAIEVADAGLGLGGSRNLLAVTFKDRPQGVANG